MHADDSYPRCENFGGSPGRNTVIIYMPDGTNVYNSRGGQFEGMPFMSYHIISYDSTKALKVL